MSYMPSKKDLDWTKEAITGKSVWGVPSAGCVFTFKHDEKSFVMYSVPNPSTSEIQIGDRCAMNLIFLDYECKGKLVDFDAKNHVELLENLKSRNSNK